MVRVKNIIIIGLLIAVLLFSGCARQQDAQTNTSAINESTNTQVTSPNGTTSPEGSTEVPLSKDSLDQLKKDLEDMEFEDLGGLTDE